VNVAYSFGSGQNPEEFYRASIRQALDEVFASLGHGYKPRNRRQLPLVALPLLGGQQGMPMVARGQLLHRLLTFFLGA
jgi:hypothetical protein